MSTSNYNTLNQKPVHLRDKTATATTQVSAQLFICTSKAKDTPVRMEMFISLTDEKTAGLKRSEVCEPGQTIRQQRRWN